MVTKLDRAVIRYLTALGASAPKEEGELVAYLDRLDRLRFEALDLLLRRSRYRRLDCRRAWRAKNNLHRPPG